MMTWRKKAVLYTVLTILAVLMVFPLLFTLSLSLSDNVDIMNGNYIPSTLHFENYVEAFHKVNLLYYMKNSIIISSVTTVVQVVLALLTHMRLYLFHLKGEDLYFLFLCQV